MVSLAGSPGALRRRARGVRKTLAPDVLRCVDLRVLGVAMGCAPEGVPVELVPVPAGQACVRSGDRHEGAALPGGPVLQPGPDGERLLILKSSLFCLPLPGPRFAPVATPGAMPEPGLRQHGREARGHPGRGLTDGPRDSLGPSVCLILELSVFISSSLCVYKAQAMRCTVSMPKGNRARPGTAPGRPAGRARRQP